MPAVLPRTQRLGCIVMRFYAGRVEQSALGGCLDVIAWLVDAPPSKIRMRTVPSTPSLGGGP